MPLSFLHFDSVNRENKFDGPFKSSFKLGSPIRNIKKIYLKSVEIPCGYYNIREAQKFSFMLSSGKDVGDITQIASITYTPTQQTNYNLVVNTSNNATPTAYKPYGGSRNTAAMEPIIVNVIIPIGNYTIDSLLAYINSAINNLYTNFNISFTIFANTVPALSKVQVTASSTFPVGFIQLLANSMVYITMLSNILGFTGLENSLSNIVSTKLYNINPDVCIYLYFPNIPHKNTHFDNQLVSFKLPVTSGYQAIEFNQENVNFAQYIEVSDATFILTKIQLIVYDRQGKYIDNNNFDFTFTLGVQTDD